jgi:hydroxyacylglutathione hydrolase
MAQSMIVQAVQVGPIMTNAYVVGCPETHQGAVIDPGDEARRLALLAEADELEIKKLLITHGHVDHVAAVGDLKKATGAEVLMHEADRPA